MRFRALARWPLLLIACLSLAACFARPDLARLYEFTTHQPGQPPVIVIHGLAGSTLVDARTGKEFWPGSLSTLAFSNYRELAQLSAEQREGEGLVPGSLFFKVAGVDFYGALLRSLESVGRFHPGKPGQPVERGERRYYVLLYDWRKDNILAVRKLHELVEQIRIDHGDPNLRVDIIAHSNGGLIANYYLRYGPTDVLEQEGFTPWAEGAARVRRLVMLGTPSLGAATSLERLVVGTRMALRTVPVEVMATFATPFQALPHPLAQSVLDPAGRPLVLDLFDVDTWRQRSWGVFSPEVGARVRDSVGGAEAGDAALARLQATFAHHLHRGERLHWALSEPFPAGSVEIAVFGGDCEPTPARAVMLDAPGGPRLAFRPGQIHPALANPARRVKKSGPDLERLMLEPGDGLVTRASQVGRGATANDKGSFHMLPITQTFFLCESHGRLTHNLYFQNNLLYFLLAR